MLLDLAEVAARGEEHPQQVVVGVVQRAELAGAEHPGELAAAGAAAQPGDRQVVTAHRAVARCPVLVPVASAGRRAVGAFGAVIVRPRSAQARPLVGADPDRRVAHHDLDIEPGAAVAHHDLVAGAAVAAGPADLAELGLAR